MAGTLSPAPGTIAARHACAHPIGSARDRRVGPAGGRHRQRPGRGVRRACGRPARRSLTFAQWDRAADGVAGHLAARGVAKGDVVCLLLPSCIEYAVLCAALQRLGAITSGINPRMGAAEVASIVERTVPVLLVADLGAAPLPDIPPVELAERAEIRASWEGEPPPEWPELAPHDPVAVVWTSGTRQAQGCRLRPRQPGDGGPGPDGLSQPGDRRLSPLPFAHVGYMTRASAMDPQNSPGQTRSRECCPRSPRQSRSPRAALAQIVPVGMVSMPATPPQVPVTNAARALSRRAFIR